MKQQRVLSLDISSKTGYAVFNSSLNGLKLENYGKIEKTSQPTGPYPDSYVLWAYQCFSPILQLIDQFCPDVLVIEETSKGSKNAHSQKILEYTHFLLARLIRETGIESKYLRTEEWRRILDLRMSQADKDRNKEVRNYKKKIEKETGKKPTVAYDINGKRIGLVGKKHLNVRKANELFGEYLPRTLILDDEDLADALGLGAAYHKLRMEKEK
jgi:hypothetical protein